MCVTAAERGGWFCILLSPPGSFTPRAVMLAGFFWFFCSAGKKRLDPIQRSCLEIGRDHCFGHVLPPPPPSPPVAAPSCVLLQLARCIWDEITLVCASFSIITHVLEKLPDYSLCEQSATCWRQIGCFDFVCGN